MARNLQPRSALTPPRSPAPINATRPDFPVRAGQFLGGYAAPDTDWSCVATPCVAVFADQERALLVFRGSGL
jgi:hypothetical protein